MLRCLNLQKKREASPRMREKTNKQNTRRSPREIVLDAAHKHIMQGQSIPRRGGQHALAVPGRRLQLPERAPRVRAMASERRECERASAMGVGAGAVGERISRGVGAE